VLRSVTHYTICTGTLVVGPVVLRGL